MGLNAALATASRSLEIFQAGIQVAGQNIANAQTPGYIREKILLTPDEPFPSGGLIFGTGVQAEGIVQQINLFLETRIHSANSDFSASTARESIYRQLEGELRELGDTDLSTSLNGFLATMNDVVNQAESPSLRQIAVQGGQQLAGDISSLRVRLDELRKAQSIKVDALANEANGLINNVADLNLKISKLEASGLVRSEATALRTQRYNALNRLSEIMPVRFVERANQSVDVFSGTDFLVLSGQKQQLTTFTEVDRNVSVTKVRLSTTNSLVGLSGGGELQGIIEGRDTALGGFVDELDKYTASLISEFNQVHSSGEGVKGFDTVTANDRITNTTANLNNAGLKFTPTHGSFQIKVTNKLTGITNTTDVAVDLDGIGTDTTLTSLSGNINGINNLTASITTDGRLKIDATSGFEFRFSNDTSGTLAALGINTFFTGSDSSNINLNAVVANDFDFLATGTGGGPTDNTNAVKLADFVRNPVTALNGLSLDGQYNRMISSVAQAASSETAVAEGLSAFKTSLFNQRDQFSGVSLDEEAITLLEFQNSFQAAARLISTIDELFSVLLSI